MGRRGEVAGSGRTSLLGGEGASPASLPGLIPPPAPPAEPPVPRSSAGQVFSIALASTAANPWWGSCPLPALRSQWRRLHGSPRPRRRWSRSWRRGFACVIPSASGACLAQQRSSAGLSARSAERGARTSPGLSSEGRMGASCQEPSRGAHSSTPLLHPTWVLGHPAVTLLGVPTVPTQGCRMGTWFPPECCGEVTALPRCGGIHLLWRQYLAAPSALGNSLHARAWSSYAGHALGTPHGLPPYFPLALLPVGFTVGSTSAMLLGSMSQEGALLHGPRSPTCPIATAIGVDGPLAGPCMRRVGLHRHWGSEAGPGPTAPHCGAGLRLNAHLHWLFSPFLWMQGGLLGLPCTVSYAENEPPSRVHRWWLNCPDLSPMGFVPGCSCNLLPPFCPPL